MYLFNSSLPACARNIDIFGGNTDFGSPHVPLFLKPFLKIA